MRTRPTVRRAWNGPVYYVQATLAEIAAAQRERARQKRAAAEWEARQMKARAEVGR